MHIDRHQPLDFKLTPVIINEKQQEQVEVAFTLIDGTNQTVILGAHIIKESMAALYQSFLDPDVAHNDVPYNLVKLLAEQEHIDVSQYQQVSAYAQKTQDNKEKLKRMQKLAQEFFVTSLQNSQTALNYLHEKRHLDDKLISEF